MAGAHVAATIAGPGGVMGRQHLSLSIHRGNGFTLVELLVALMLLSLIALGLGGGMRTISQTQERIDHRTEKTERQQVSIQFLRDVLGQVSGMRRLDSQGASMGRSTYFLGSSQEVQWLGSMPANFGSGGRSHMRLVLQGNQLVFQYQRWEKSNPNPDWKNAESYVLDSEITAFSLSYQSTSRTSGQQWLPAWGGAESLTPLRDLPTAMQLQVQTEKGNWPLLVIALHQSQVNSSLASGGPVFGGTSRE